MNFTINSLIEETFEYRHKKFDQLKRLSNDSTNSSSEEYECIKVEIERLEERPYSQTSSESTTAYNNTQWSSAEMYATQYNSLKRNRTTSTSDSNYSVSEKEYTSDTPAAKRMRTTSSSGSTYSATFSPLQVQPLRYSSTPFIQSALTQTPFAAPALTPSAAILPKISDETLHSICKYHGNMVRKFPKKERTPKDQERRNKNTIACRMSRRVKKLEHIAIEEQYKEFSQQTFQIIEQSMRATAYLHELMKLSAVTSNNEEVPSLESPAKFLDKDEKPSVSPGQKKPFTIAFLTGNEN